MGVRSLHSPISSPLLHFFSLGDPTNFLNVHFFAQNHFNSRRLVPVIQGLVHFQNETYAQGYLEKDFRMANLDFYSVNPSLDEVQTFNGALGVTPQNTDLKQLNDLSVSQNQFVVGEEVVIIEGEIMNVRGTVMGVTSTGRGSGGMSNKFSNSGGSGMVQVRFRTGPQDDQFLTSEFKPSSLQKRFSQGDHVKVIKGQHMNESGLVLKLEDNKVTLLSDLNMKEVWEWNRLETYSIFFLIFLKKCVLRLTRLLSFLLNQIHLLQ